jgi:hypothetical protein
MRFERNDGLGIHLPQRLPRHAVTSTWLLELPD